MPILRRRPKRGKARHPLYRTLRCLTILAIGVSVIQYLQRGEVSWPATLYKKMTVQVSEYPSRSFAGWRRAADRVTELGAHREGTPVPNVDLEGRVVKIIDGDSLSLLDQKQRQHTIRLYGIDTPEWDQPHGGVAKVALERMVGGRRVGVVSVDTDTFGRTVGTLYMRGQNINLAMVEAGHAWWFTRYAPYERHLSAAEESARDRGLGLWASSDPVAPWHWRRRQH